MGGERALSAAGRAKGNLDPGLVLLCYCLRCFVLLLKAWPDLGASGQGKRKSKRRSLSGGGDVDLRSLSLGGKIKPHFLLLEALSTGLERRGGASHW